jgi:hypothetical protein
MKSEVDWKGGDEIVLGGWGVYQAERRTISSVDNDKRTINLQKPLTYYHPSGDVKVGSKTIPQNTEGSCS